jgi:hypothetical protein
MPPFRSYEHLVRLAALFAVGVALFLGLRSVLVPADYGRLGPYRAGALAANQARPIVYAGQAACVDCHSDVADIRKTNAHARISCESCHGPLAGHAMDPAVPVIPPNPRAICAVCHLPSDSKPPDFKTVDFTHHASAEACTTCHRSHAPKL